MRSSVYKALCGILLLMGWVWSAQAQTQQLSSGWNLVHTGDVSSSELANLLAAESEIHSVWGYHTATGTWKVAFNIDVPNNPFATLSSLDAGKGYWFRTTGNVNVPTGAGSPSVDDDEGWFLVGTSEGLSPSQAIPSLPAFDENDLTSGGTIWIWYNSQWQLFANGTVSDGSVFNRFDTLASIPANSGFWVNMGSTTQVFPPVIGGTVATYPTGSTSGTSQTRSSINPFRETNGQTKTSYSQDDMTPAKALVSVYELTDSDYENPIATVKTDDFGNYEISAGDIKEEFLASKGTVEIDGNSVVLTDLDVSNDSDRATLETYIKSLGNLQVRAIVVKTQKDGTKKPLAIKAIVDPEDGTNTKINPIVSRVVEDVIRSVEAALEPIRGLLGEDNAALADSLIKGVLKTVETTIKAVLEIADVSTIEIPEGQDPEEFFENQEDGFAMDLGSTYTLAVSDLDALENDGLPADTRDKLDPIADQQFPDRDSLISQLELMLTSTEVELYQDKILSFADDALKDLNEELEQDAPVDENKIKDKVSVKQKANEDVDTKSTLGSGEAGLLGNLKNAINEGVSKAATEDETISNNEDFAAVNQEFLREGFQDYFLTLGYNVVLAGNEEAAVVAVRVQAPGHIMDQHLPGTKLFDEGQLRYFKVGNGTILYNGEEVVDLASGLTEKLLRDFSDSPDDPSSVQSAVDEISQNQFNLADGDPDLTKLDRLRLYHELAHKLANTPLVSDEVIKKLVSNRDKTVKLSTVAKHIATHFKWVTEKVNVTEEGFPVYSGRFSAPSSGATVSASKIVRLLAITLDKNPANTAIKLTSDTNFLGSIAPDGIEETIQRAGANANLAEIYPETAEGYQTLLAGNRENGVSASPAYEYAKDRIERGLTASINSDLFGSTLTSETQVSLKTAFYLLNYLLDQSFVIDQAKGKSGGYFTEIDLNGTVRLRPFYENLKRLKAQNENFTVGEFFASLLNESSLNESEAFALANELLKDPIANLMPNLPTLPEFKEQDLEEVGNQILGGEVANVSCVVERFDGLDPRDPQQNTGDGKVSDDLSITLFKASFEEDTGIFFADEALNIAPIVELEPSEGNGAVRVRYTWSGVPAVADGKRGLDYIAVLDIPAYQNDIPNLPFFVDGFAENVNPCPHPAFVIGADVIQQAVPGFGLVSDQFRFEFDDEGNSFEVPEGVDLSNFEIANAPFFLTEDQEAEGMGLLDFMLLSSDGGLALVAKGDGKAQFFPLSSTVVENKLAFIPSLDNPVFGIQTVLGSNLRDVVSAIETSNAAGFSAFPIDPDNFNPNFVGLFRDRESRYWVLELRFVDQFEEEDGNFRYFLDIGFAKINSRGEVEIPQEAYGEENPEGVATKYLRAAFGDYLVIEPPTGYEGPDVLPPAAVDFEDNSEIRDILENSTDGVVVRYAGETFDEEIGEAIEDGAKVDEAFKDFDSAGIPSRLDVVGQGLTLTKLTFRNNTRDYILSPDPNDADVLVDELKHGDVVAFMKSTGQGKSPVYLGRVVRENTNLEGQNFDISLDLIPFQPSQDEAQSSDVVCFDSNQSCPDDLPSLFLSSDLSAAAGIVFDADYDGVPAVYDPNDQDANIPGNQAPASGGGDATEPGGQFNQVNIVFSSEPSGDEIKHSFLVNVFGYPGDIKEVSLQQKELLNSEEFIKALTCTPPRESNGLFIKMSCAKADLNGASLDFINDGEVGFKINVLRSRVENLGNRLKFKYKVTYRKPVGLDGNPLQCGNSDCEAKPTDEGTIDVTIPDLSNLSTFKSVKIKIGNDGAVDFFELAKKKDPIDVSREIVISAQAIDGANFYNLSIHCEGKDSGDEFLPEFTDFLGQPGLDEDGQAVPPRFQIGPRIPGGRTCDFELEAELFNSAGLFTGSMRAVFPDMPTTGGTGGFGGNNELKLVVGDQVCFEGHVEQVQGSCPGESIPLFGVSTLGSTATISLDSEVSHASYGPQPMVITEGRLGENSVVQVDNLEDGSCGQISTEENSFTCQPGGLLFDLLMVNGDVLQLVPTTMSIGGPTDQDGNIPLSNPGFFTILNQNQESVYEIDVQAFEKFDNEGQTSVKENFIFLHRAPDLTEFTREDSNIDPVNFNVSEGYLSLQLKNENQPIDFEIRFLNAERMKVNWFLPAPGGAQLAGDFELDGNNEIDVRAARNNDNHWVFEFPTAESVEIEDPIGVFNAISSRNDNGELTYTVDPAEADEARFNLVLDQDREYKFIGRDLNGEGSGEFFEIFVDGGNPSNPGGSGNLFESQMGGGDYITFEDDVFEVLFLPDPAPTDFFLYIDVDVARFGSGWQLEAIEDNPTDSLDLQTLGANVYRVKNSEKNLEFDVAFYPEIIEGTLYSVFVEIMPPAGPSNPGGGAPDFFLNLSTAEFFSIYFDTVKKEFTTENTGAVMVMEVEVKSSGIKVEAAEDFKFTGQTGETEALQVPYNDRENRYEIISENPEVPGKELVIGAFEDDLFLRIQPLPVFFADFLYINDGINVEEHSNPNGNTFVSVFKGFYQNVSMVDTDGSDGMQTAMWMTNQDSQVVLELFNNWKLQNIGSDEVVADANTSLILQEGFSGTYLLKSLSHEFIVNLFYNTDDGEPRLDIVMNFQDQGPQPGGEIRYPLNLSDEAAEAGQFANGEALFSLEGTLLKYEILVFGFDNSTGDKLRSAAVYAVNENGMADGEALIQLVSANSDSELPNFIPPVNFDEPYFVEGELELDTDTITLFNEAVQRFGVKLLVHSSNFSSIDGKYLLGGMVGAASGGARSQGEIYPGDTVVRSENFNYQIIRSGEEVPTEATLVATLGEDGQTLNLVAPFTANMKNDEGEPVSVVTGQDEESLWELFEDGDHVNDLRVKYFGSGLFVEVLPPGAGVDRFEEAFEAGDQLYYLDGEFEFAAFTEVIEGGMLVATVQASSVVFATPFSLYTDAGEVMEVLLDSIAGDLFGHLKMDAEGELVHIADLRVMPTMQNGFATTPVIIETFPVFQGGDPNAGGHFIELPFNPIQDDQGSDILPGAHGTFYYKIYDDPNSEGNILEVVIKLEGVTVDQVGEVEVFLDTGTEDPANDVYITSLADVDSWFMDQELVVMENKLPIDDATREALENPENALYVAVLTSQGIPALRADLNPGHDDALMVLEPVLDEFDEPIHPTASGDAILDLVIDAEVTLSVNIKLFDIGLDEVGAVHIHTTNDIEGVAASDSVVLGLLDGDEWIEFEGGVSANVVLTPDVSLLGVMNDPNNQFYVLVHASNGQGILRADIVRGDPDGGGDPVGDFENGRSIYEASCANCHGGDGTGGVGPTLWGCASCGSVDQLIDLIETTMPQADAASCVDTCAEDVAAFILGEYNAPAEAAVR